MALVGVLGLSQSKDVPSRVGYIDAQKVIESHPRFSEVKAIQDKADKEVKPLVDQIKALSQKIKDGSASSKDRQDLQSLQKVYAQTSKKWQDKINTVLAPITKEIDKTIAQVAVQNGFSMVLSANVAGQSGLVVYASPDSDLTELVIKALTSGK